LVAFIDSGKGLLEIHVIGIAVPMEINPLKGVLVFPNLRRLEDAKLEFQSKPVVRSVRPRPVGSAWPLKTQMVWRTLQAFGATQQAEAI
jgi:hypothetical protein